MRARSTSGLSSPASRSPAEPANSNAPATPPAGSSADAPAEPPSWILGYEHPDVLFAIDPLLLEVTFDDDGNFAGLHIRQG